MSRRFRIFVTQRARDEAVDRICAAFLDFHQRRSMDGQERNGEDPLSPATPSPPVRIAEPPGRPGWDEPTQRSDSGELLLGERLILVCAAVLTVLLIVWPR